MSLDDIQIQSIKPKKLISFLKAMEFKTLTEKKSTQFNLSSDEIESQELNLNFIPEKKVQESLQPTIDIKKFDYEDYVTIENTQQLNEWKEINDKRLCCN